MAEIYSGNNRAGGSTAKAAYGGAGGSYDSRGAGSGGQGGTYGSAGRSSGSQGGIYGSAGRSSGSQGGNYVGSGGYGGGGSGTSRGGGYRGGQSGDRGSSGAGYRGQGGRQDTGLPEKPHQILDPNTYVNTAEDVIKTLRSTRRSLLTTSKIRNLLSMISSLYDEVRRDRSEKLTQEQKNRIQYIRLHFAYEAGRDNDVKAFVTEADIFAHIKDIGDDRQRFLLFCRYMEALVAYHRFHGGKEWTNEGFSGGMKNAASKKGMAEKLAQEDEICLRKS